MIGSIRAAAVACATVAAGLGASALGAETWAERLGYPAGKRVLILHADDVGMCYEANHAAKTYLEAGHIQSAAAMVPCPWFDEFAAWSKEHPDADVGVHLTLTSEWKLYRWGPVAPKAEVPRLVGPDGYFPRSVIEVAIRATPEEVEREIRAQIDRAIARGLRPGHIDTHMGTLYARPDYTRAYLKVAQEYGIPAMVIELTPENVGIYRKEGMPITDELIALAKEYPLPKIDRLVSVPDGASYDEVRAKFFAMIEALPPGITQVIFHPSIESEGLKRITNSWRQRVDEGRLFADPETIAFFRDEGILFTNWKEMMRRHRERPVR